jgi:hypothetical protein
MEKLELKHLAPYLPYQVNFTDITLKPRWTLMVANISVFDYINHKLILHPLSDLTKEIEHNGEKFVPLVELFKLIKNVECEILITNDEHYSLGYNSDLDCYYMIFDNIEFEFGEYEVEFYFQNNNLVLNVPVWFNNVISNNYDLYGKLFEWHFDVFGLIEKGLAIDINTI